VVSLRSYQCPWSIHCLSSSIGGCAPYFSLAGMLRSSTNAMHFRPSGGPYTPFRRLKVSQMHTTISYLSFQLNSRLVAVTLYHPFPHRAVKSIVRCTCMSACVSVCPVSTCISGKPHGRTTPNLSCMLTVTVARTLLAALRATRYTLPVL